MKSLRTFFIVFALTTTGLLMVLLLGKTRLPAEDTYLLRERTTSGGFIPGRIFEQSFVLPEIPVESPGYEVGLSIATYNRKNPGDIHFTFSQGDTTAAFVREGLKLKDNHPLFFSLPKKDFETGIAKLEVYSDNTPQGFGATAWATTQVVNHALVLNGNAQDKTMITRVFKKTRIWDTFQQRIPSLLPRLVILLTFSFILSIYLYAIIHAVKKDGLTESDT